MSHLRGFHLLPAENTYWVCLSICPVCGNETHGAELSQTNPRFSFRDRGAPANSQSHILIQIFISLSIITELLVDFLCIILWLLADYVKKMLDTMSICNITLSQFVILMKNNARYWMLEAGALG